jgi:hypothetical protein
VSATVGTSSSGVDYTKVVDSAGVVNVIERRGTGGLQ